MKGHVKWEQLFICLLLFSLIISTFKKKPVHGNTCWPFLQSMNVQTIDLSLIFNKDNVQYSLQSVISLQFISLSGITNTHATIKMHTSTDIYTETTSAIQLLNGGHKAKQYTFKILIAYTLLCTNKNQIQDPPFSVQDPEKMFVFCFNCCLTSYTYRNTRI